MVGNMKKWEILNTYEKFDKDKIIEILLSNRGIKTKKEIDSFFNPELSDLTAQNLEINKEDLKKAVKRINLAISKKERIIVFGDYDVDGITGTAILWETLNSMKANVMPYIPNRIEEGYGLSKVGIENLKNIYPDTSLIITVDNGIVASPAVEFANSLGIDVIITDHHAPEKTNPKAFAIVHSTKICGSAVAWFLSRELGEKSLEHLGLVALATVADMMKLTDYNRTLLIHGLKELKKNKRVGINALLEIAGVNKEQIGVYEIGHIIGPRINAMGRLEDGMESLRLICTKDKKRAQELANKLNFTNLERQKVTLDSVLHAKNSVEKDNLKKLLFIYHESYQPGVIGLIAGKLVEEFYRPSIVLSVGEKYSKASARSISGFNIIEFIRLSSHLLVDAGGHPMAAGFTVETQNLDKLKTFLEELSEKKLTEDLFVKVLKIDTNLNLSDITQDLFEKIKTLEPFGYGNSEPTFVAKDIRISDLRPVGKTADHLKLKLTDNEGQSFNGIYFNFDKSLELRAGEIVECVFSISENEWNGNKKLELKIKDIKK